MKELLTRKGKPTPELKGLTEQTVNGITAIYEELYYLDYDVNEFTGKVSKDIKAKFYTDYQVDQNMDVFKDAYYKEKINNDKYNN